MTPSNYPKWTDEDDRIVEEYENKFYHIGYPVSIIDAILKNYEQRDNIFSSAECEVYHPKMHIMINIVGRDH